MYYSDLCRVVLCIHPQSIHLSVYLSVEKCCLFCVQKCFFWLLVAVLSCPILL